MEALGINGGFLLIQLLVIFGMFVLPITVIGGIVYWLRRRDSAEAE